MKELFINPYLIYLVLFVLSSIAYIISTVSGGGGSLLLVPVVSILLGTKVTSPVLNLGNLIGQPVRILLFWKYIDWRVSLYYVPTAILGTISGAWVFSNLRLQWFQILIGLFLISAVFQYRFGKKKGSFTMKLKGFIPLGFFVAFFS